MRGWTGESRRHAMAAKGITSGRITHVSRGISGTYTTQFFEKYEDEIIGAWESDWIQEDGNEIAQDVFDLLYDIVNPSPGQSEEHTEAQRIKAEDDLRLIVRDDELMGFVRWKPTYPLEYGEETYEGIKVDKVFIIPEYRRAGMGREVIGDIFQENPDIDFINGVAIEQAHPFWHNLGAELGPEMRGTGRRPFTLWREDFEAGRKGTYFEDLIPPGLYR